MGLENINRRGSNRTEEEAIQKIDQTDDDTLASDDVLAFKYGEEDQEVQIHQQEEELEDKLIESLSEQSTLLLEVQQEEQGLEIQQLLEMEETVDEVTTYELLEDELSQEAITALAEQQSQEESETIEAFEALEGLNPVRFNYMRDAAEDYVGFIAEDVPELVATKDRKGISTMDVVAVLTKVVQEQKKIIREQKDSIQDQEKVNIKQQTIIIELLKRIEALEREK